MRSSIGKKFFLRPALEVAPDLLGFKLTTRIDGIETSGVIVEVEAYDGEIDEACHAYKGQTARNSAMFRSGGHCYVYFIYGMHYCVNVVTGKAGQGSAVLIRAIEPISGIDEMLKRRKLVASARNLINLTNGPSKVCQALKIEKYLSGEYFQNSKQIKLEPHLKIKSNNIGISSRIGISKSMELPWRFFVRKNPWVSVKIK